MAGKKYKIRLNLDTRFRAGGSMTLLYESFTAM